MEEILQNEEELQQENLSQQYKQYRKTISHLGWCYVAGTILIQLLQNVIAYAIYILKPELLQSVSFSLVLSSVIIYGMGMPLIILLARRMPKTSIERHQMKWWQFIIAMMICYSLMIISNLIGTMLTWVIAYLKGSPVNNNLVEYVTESNIFLNFILMVIVAPIAEEYVFRKIIVDRTVHLGQGIAIAVSGLMFGLFHGNLNQFAYTVGLGAFFAFIYIKTGNIKITIGMHAIINFFGGIISVLMFRLITQMDQQALMTLDSSDTDAVLEYAISHVSDIVALSVLALFEVLVFGIVLAGFVLFIVFFKRFKLEPGTVPKGQRLKTLFANPGMIFLCAIYIVLIILQLLL